MVNEPRRNATLRVDLRRDGFAMHRINAASVATEMVEVQASGDGLAEQFVQNAMGGHISASDFDAPVTVAVVLAVPQPTLAEGWVNDRPVEDHVREDTFTYISCLPLPVRTDNVRTTCTLPAPIVGTAPDSLFARAFAALHGADGIRGWNKDRDIGGDVTVAAPASPVGAAERPSTTGAPATFDRTDGSLGGHRELILSGVTRRAVTAAPSHFILRESVPAVEGVG